MTYLEMVKDSIEELIGNNGLDTLAGWLRAESCEGLDELEDRMVDFFYSEDDITGYVSKTYYFNPTEAKEMVLKNQETVVEAVHDFYCGRPEEAIDALASEKWEWLDMTARCYVVAEAVSEYVTENKDELINMIKAYKGA